MHQALTVKELAKILGDSPAHIYRRIHKGEIEGVFRDGRHIKICPGQFVEWLKKEIAQGSRPRKRSRKPSTDNQSPMRVGFESGEATQKPEAGEPLPGDCESPGSDKLNLM